MCRARFWVVMGDVHDRIELAASIPEISEASCVFLSGDLTNMGKPSDAERIIAFLRDLGPEVYAQIGNMDFPEINDLLTRQGRNLHGQGVKLGHGVGFIGVGCSNKTPFHTPSEVQDVKLGKWLRQAYLDVRDQKHLVLISHTPPYKTKTDIIRSGKHVGSLAIREFVENVQPDVFVCGHIHESVAEDYLGSTKVINPGMLSRGGYVLLTRTENGITGELKKFK